MVPRDRIEPEVKKKLANDENVNGMIPSYIKWYINANGPDTTLGCIRISNLDVLLIVKILQEYLNKKGYIELEVK